MASGFDVDEQVKLLDNLNYLIVSYYNILFIDCDVIVFSFPGIDMCERYFRNLRPRILQIDLVYM